MQRRALLPLLGLPPGVPPFAARHVTGAAATPMAVPGGKTPFIYTRVSLGASERKPEALSVRDFERMWVDA